MSESAYVIHPVLNLGQKKQSDKRSVEDELAEITSLVSAIDLEVCASESLNIQKPSPSHLLGKGTVERIAENCAELKPDVVIINHALSPVQQRNLERAIKCKVIDRTGLILEIFGERASTKEGRIQVELAALEYQKSRLVRSWTHLERQRGGAGFMGGPGETQIEIDRRLIADRITSLKKQLESVKKTRDLGRKARERVPFPIIALVGYTNAGKSTLFNTLTKADVMAEDMLFATLDPTMRKLELPNGQSVILADTVGFISDLPTSLIAAFRSTLEQVQYADIILHVRDIAREDTEAQKQDVIDVMNDLDIDYEADKRVIEVWNKIDTLDEEDKDSALSAAQRKKHIEAVSAITGEGLNNLLNTLSEKLNHLQVEHWFYVSHDKGEALSWLYEHGGVIEREDRMEDVAIHVKLAADEMSRFITHFDIHPATEEDRDTHVINLD
ncbi:MAG: GTPase HflX [Pseudomonadota bacterium]